MWRSAAGSALDTSLTPAPTQAVFSHLSPKLSGKMLFTASWVPPLQLGEQKTIIEAKIQVRSSLFIL
jgi:hypothetical protein